MPVLCGRQFRRRGNQALSDHGHDQVSFAAALRRDQAIQLELADHFQDGLHVAVRESLFGGEKILRGDQGLVAEQAAEGFDFFLGPMGEVGQGALAGFVAIAPAFAEEDGGRGVTVGDDGDVHALTKSHYTFTVNGNITIT